MFSVYRNTAEKVSEIETTKTKDSEDNTENHGADLQDMKNKNPTILDDCSSNSGDPSLTVTETVTKEAEEKLSEEKHQSSINQFILNPKCKSSDTVTVDDIVSKLDTVLKLVSGNKKSLGEEKKREKKMCCGSSATNITEFITEQEDIEVIGGPDKWTVRCKICFVYMNSKTAVRNAQHLPSSGNLSTGLNVVDEVYQKYMIGHNVIWYRFKNRLLNHFDGETCKTHVDAAAWWHFTRPVRKRKCTVVKNQLRAAIGVVKSKSAARCYEERIAELHLAGADVGDYGHSRNLFNDMIRVVNYFIDKRTQKFLQDPLPNTGILPHFYITADKSTNHRITNQVTMVCPVVNGKRQAIPLGMTDVYQDATGQGGKGEELAAKLYEDLNRHANILTNTTDFLKVQGRVFDGQYLNAPFTSKMNEPLEQLLSKKRVDEDKVGKDHGDKSDEDKSDDNSEDDEEESDDDSKCDENAEQEDPTDALWWPLQWDPGHWLDKVFGKYKGEPFISRLITRTNYVHHLFSHGKSHSVSKATAAELELPFLVTVSFAHQRFMSSSYNQFLKLERSLEVYIETYRDHDNREIGDYKIAGNDFVFDLLGTIDLLWPLVLLMLRGQLLWCPGWKFVGWLPLVKSQMKKFAREIKCRNPSKLVCPRIHEHGNEIKNLRFVAT
jgi:hypothetical protein